MTRINGREQGRAMAGWEVIRLFQGLEIGKGGPAMAAGDGRPIFLRQSTLDCACGPNSVFMALIALGLFGREQLTASNAVQTAFVAEMQRRAKKYHFRGIGPRGLRDIVAPVARRIEWRLLNGIENDIAGYTLEQMEEGRLVILGVENPRLRFYHWVLVVGMQGTEKCGRFRPHRFLLLDPNEDQPTHTAWNSIVHFAPQKTAGRYRLMHGMRGSEKLVALNGAVAIGRRW